MTQDVVDKVYTKPIVLGDKQKTISISLLVDSTDGYRWFLVSPDYDYIRSVSFAHKSVDVENSKYGSTDNFKFRLQDSFKKIPQKMVLHFECFRPFDNDSQIISKDIVVLSVLD
ncbi:hypothetical protein IB642_00360 [Allofrancisella guangzhouensis]|nr:hypothetical protein [Allofrancisella guangzhouensis]MBK2027732.1 hypothetical protein [Allofrancisella guangzhouensis]MBK2043470.1 hypothetical protein [Allofrancisella guangzhouensis]MBK2045827.1 hypothetical protein [Allofrancisella guangzhouensis]